MSEPGEAPGREAGGALEPLLLDGPRRYTRLQVAELAGMPPERTLRLWRALGFPDAADDELVFTDADVQALSVLSELIDSGFVDTDTEASVARAMGQALSRLADWQTDMLAEALNRPEPGGGWEGPPPEPPTRPGPGGGWQAATPEEAVDVARELLPKMQDIQSYVWRRHLAAN